MNLTCIEIKAYVPAKDYSRSRQFYTDLGFEMRWDMPEACCFEQGPCRFILQNFYEPAHAQNCMMHLLVEDAKAWYQTVEANVITKYGVHLTPLETQPWGLLEFCLFDPSGVIWRIGQMLPAQT